MTEEEIQRGSTKRQIARLIGNATVPIYVLGHDDRILFANDALAKLVGIETESLLGLDCSKNIPAEMSQVSRTSAVLALPPNADRTVAQWHAIALPGEEKHRICISFPIDDATPPMVFCAIKEDQGEQEFLLGSGHRSHLRQLILRSSSESAIQSDLWFLFGASPAILRARKQIQTACQDGYGVHVFGPAPSSTLAVAKWISQKRRNAPPGSASPSPIVVECRLMDRELLRGTLEMVEEQSRMQRKIPGSVGVVLHQIDALPESLMDQLCSWKYFSNVSMLATSASNDLISLYPAHEPWGELAATLEAHVVHVPSLAQRVLDIELLVVAWLQMFEKREDATEKYRWTREFLDAMLAYSWPGDIEEFDGVMREAIHRCQGRLMTDRDLPSSLRTYPSHVRRPEPIAKIDLDHVLEQIERELIQRAMAHFPRNRTAVAAQLGISRARLLRRLQQLGLEQPDPSRHHDPEELIFEEWNDTSPGTEAEPDER